VELGCSSTKALRPSWGSPTLGGRGLLSDKMEPDRLTTVLLGKGLREGLQCMAWEERLLPGLPVTVEGRCDSSSEVGRALSDTG